jgi:cobalamin biosynthesis protein CobD/CbiB
LDIGDIKSANDTFKQWQIQIIVGFYNIIFFVSFIFIVKWFKLKEVSYVLPFFMAVVAISNSIKFHSYCKDSDGHYEGIREDFFYHNGNLDECNRKEIFKGYISCAGTFII